MTKQIAVLGCGWLGLPLGSSLVAKGHNVKGSTTSTKKLAEIKSKGISPYLISLFENEIKGDIAGFLNDIEILIINIPPKLRKSPRENFVNKMQLLYDAITKSDVQKVIFVSSTSVYGSIDAEVSETTIPQPTTESGKQLLAAESIFKNSDKFQTSIVRFGGLISEDRHPIHMLSGRQQLANGHHPVNLIHRNDCISVIEYIIHTNFWSKMINGVYPYHPSKQEYYTQKALQLGIQTPEYQKNTSSKGKRVVPETLLNVKDFSFKTSISS